MPYIILSGILAIIIVLLFYSIFSSKVQTTNIITQDNPNLNPQINKAVQLIGGDIYALIPESAKTKRRHNHNMQKLFVSSGNPWHISQIEFLLIQVLLALAGFVASFIAGLFLASYLSVWVLFVLIILIPALGWYYPVSVYKAKRNARLSAYKTDLPEAIDFLVIALSGGSTGLPSAIKVILQYLPEKSIMYNEFKQIINDLDSGKSISAALDDFAKRAPTESIQAFVKALNSAQRMSTPLDSILRARANSSRRDLEGEIDTKISQLSTKVMMIIGPVAYMSIMIIAMAPAATVLMKVL